MAQGAGAVSPRSGKCGERLPGFLGPSVNRSAIGSLVGCRGVPLHLEPEDQLSESHPLGGEGLQIDPERPEPEPAHLVTEVGRDAQHAVGGFHDPKAEAASLVVLDADEHSIEAIKIELFRQCRSKDGGLHTPPRQRRCERPAEGFGLARLTLHR